MKKIEWERKVKMVSVDKLKEHPLNTTWFPSNADTNLAPLYADIKADGINVELRAKRDGTVLDGHTRLKVAELLNIKEVPVIYLKQGVNLTKDRERKIIIGLQLNRRHITKQRRLELYQLIYPDIYKMLDVPQTKINRNAGIAVDIAKIAEETDIPKSRVTADLTGARKARSIKSARSKTSVPSANVYKKINEAMNMLLKSLPVLTSTEAKKLLPVGLKIVSKLNNISKMKTLQKGRSSKTKSKKKVK